MILKLTIAYAGEPFAGWQSQAHGTAVQDLIEAALLKIVGRRVVVHGAGRTDAGVHALAQCAHIEVDSRLTPAVWMNAINANLPPTIRVLRAVKAPAGFHARFSAKGKVYRYEINNAPVLPPLEVGRAWHAPKPLDFGVLRDAAQIFVGTHDFAPFAANRGKPVKDTTRTIHRITVSQKGPTILLTFQGEGFLYKMVRMLSAAIIRCAQGGESVAEMRQRLENGTPKWNHVAPAEGLYLVRVIY